jgi:hypothetical protein
MLCGETVPVCSENRTKHTDTLWAVRTPQETHHVSATEPNRLMLFGGRVVVYCENRTEHTHTTVVSPYLTGNTSRLRYRAQPVNAVWRNSRCLLCENHTEHTDTLWAVRTPQETHHVSATKPNQLMLCGEQSLFAVRTVRNTQTQ